MSCRSRIRRVAKTAQFDQFRVTLTCGHTHVWRATTLCPGTPRKGQHVICPTCHPRAPIKPVSLGD